MAKYTLSFADFLLNGGEIPEIFSEIEGFEDLFINWYCDKEIGFETEALFELKLNTYAQIFIPQYKQKISAMVTALTNTENPIKTYYDSGDITFDVGETASQNTELPFNASDATPSATFHSDDSQNKTTNNLTREESGVTVSESWMIVENINKNVKPLIHKLLMEFRPCFMGVF